MKRLERLAGAVERFVCGSGGRVEVSKCRAVLGTAFAGVGRSRVVGVMMGRSVQLEIGGQCRPASLGLCAGSKSQSKKELYLEQENALY